MSFTCPGNEKDRRIRRVGREGLDVTPVVCSEYSELDVDRHADLG
jgi:hypothetical protein